jgi:hypothetical protein
MTTIRDIANTLTNEFSRAVSQAEHNDSIEIERILQLVNSSYQNFMETSACVRDLREQAANLIRESIELEDCAMNTYQRDMGSLTEALHTLRQTKRTLIDKPIEPVQQRIEKEMKRK